MPYKTLLTPDCPVVIEVSTNGDHLIAYTPLILRAHLMTQAVRASQDHATIESSRQLFAAAAMIEALVKGWNPSKTEER